MATSPIRGRDGPVKGKHATDRRRSAAVSDRHESASHELESIAYLLKEIPRWRKRGWIGEDCSGLLTDEYQRRRASLLAAPESTVHPQETHNLRSAQESPAIAVQTKTEPGGTSFAEIMEAPSMKLLALLAALFILVGMRQILVWKWAGAVTIALIPLLPLFLTGIFYFFGVKSQNERSVGGYVYCVVAIFLSVFTVFSINEQWLGGWLAQSASLALGMCAATSLAAWTLKQTRDAAFLHVLLGTIAATVYTTLRAIFPSPWLAPEPAWIYGSALIGLAIVYLMAARKLSGTGAASDRKPDITRSIVVWMHFSAITALLIGLAPYAAGRGSEIELGFLLALAAVLYALFAWSFTGAAAVYASASMAIASALLLLAGTQLLGWYSAGLAAAGLSIAGLIISAHSKQPAVSTNARDRVIAGEWTAWALGSVAGACLIGRFCTSLVGMAAPAASVDWIAGAILGALCGAIFGYIGSRTHRSEVLFATVISYGFALTVTTNRLLALSRALPSQSLAHDLLPFTIGSLAIGVWIAKSTTESGTSRLAEAARPLLWSGLASALLGLTVILIRALIDGATLGLWIAVLAYGAISASAIAMQRLDRDHDIGSGWAYCLAFAAAIFVAFLSAIHSPPTPWTPLLASGVGLTLLAWGWFFLALRLVSSSAILRNAFSVSAGTIALIAGGLATSGVDGTEGWMTLVFAAALALLATMGAQAKSIVPVLASFILVLLCPMRLAGVAFDAHGAVTPAVLYAVLFALAAAAFYGVDAWRMSRPNVAWLSAASLLIAGGGGVLFGDRQVMLSRTIAETAGLGMGVGAFGLLLSGVWGRKPALNYAAAGIGVAAYIRLATVFLEVERLWLAVVLLPMVALLLAVSHLRSNDDDATWQMPLVRVATAASYLALFLMTAAGVGAGQHAYFALTITLFGYAVVFGFSVLVGSHIDHLQGVLSTGALVGGWFFGLQVPPGDPYRDATNMMLVAVTGICAVLYGRVALHLKQGAPAYGASLAGCCAWIALIGRVFEMPATLWSIYSLPFLVGMFVMGISSGRNQSAVVERPLKTVAASAAGIAVIWAVGMGILQGVAISGWIVWVTVALYGAAFVVGAGRFRTSRWVSAAAASFTLAFGYAVAAHSTGPADWAWRFAPAGIILVAVAGYLERRTADPLLAIPLYRLGSLTAAALVLTALTLFWGAAKGNAGLVAFVAAGAVEAALWRSGRGAVHAHAAFLALLPGYYILLRGTGAVSADVYAFPAGIYLLVLAQLAARRGIDFATWTMRWAGALALLGTSFGTFCVRYSQGGSPGHAIILLLECVAIVAWGIIGRIRCFVLSGTVFALLFVGYTSLASAEVWTGLFSVTLGIALLATVFYVSVHQAAFRNWVNHMGAVWMRKS